MKKLLTILSALLLWANIAFAAPVQIDIYSINDWHGWRALLPEGLRVPPEPLDGYAAAVLVKRYLNNK